MRLALAVILPSRLRTVQVVTQEVSMSITRAARFVVCITVLLLCSPQGARAQEFGYFGSLGPAFWDTLNPAWTACGSGEIQSPIDFGKLTLLAGRSKRLAVDYGVTTGEIFNNGHTIEVETTGPNVLTLGDVEYELDQFHFHTPSEHRFAGRGFDMEMHLVHKSAAGDTAVVGIFLRRGTTSGALATVFENLPAVDAPLNTKTALPPFDVGTFLPRSKGNYRYLGSLTTPPCTEGVHWVVLEDVMPVSDEDMAQFARRIAFNARFVQRQSR
jgi:carbonic anhydrase